MRRFLKHQPASMLMVIIALFALLVLLATLQFRWLGQVSDGERERMQAALRASAARFCEDFDRELARAFVTLQMDAETLRRRAWDKYADRYARWEKQTRYPQLVSRVILVTADHGNQLHASRWSPATKQFEAVEWPAELKGLRERLDERRHDVLLNAGFAGPALLPPLDEEIPALVMSVLPFNPPEIKPPVREWTLPLNSFTGCVIAVLNHDYIREEFIPALASRYFSSGPGSKELDYHLSIVSRLNPKKPIYSTAPDLLNGTSSGVDAAGGLMSMRFDLVDNFSFDTATPETRMLYSRPGRGVVTGVSVQAIPAAEPPRGAGRPQSGFMRSATGTVSVAAPPPGAVFFTHVESAPWQLLLRHRTGSLDTAVSQLRHRNLLVSFSILLLLAASVALIHLSALRARRLARQQIEFIAGVSHELRVPVSVVCLTSANLADGLVRDPEQVRQYGSLLRNSGRRLAEAIEQVLDFAGTEMIRRPWQLCPVEVPPVIEQALAACRPDLRTGGFEIRTELVPGLPPVNADGAALERAIRNLLSNAMKYSGTGQVSPVPYGVYPQVTGWSIG
ncbi:MAG TPA: HAMP domain-containing sensor histidine kinase [Blastocatellia bacterium]|nr:HAMP domain-containing sensor histidine kinase [Blastocatellia bacterium]